MHRGKVVTNSIQEQETADIRTADVFGVAINAIGWNTTCATISGWSLKNESRYICICNVHSIVTGVENYEFAKVLNAADMATPDGAPVAWMLRWMGYSKQPRINGPDLLWKYCRVAEQNSEKIFLYGGSPETLDKLENKLRQKFQDLKIAGAISPPYRELTNDEDAQDINEINKSGAGVVFVSLGCPKQEIWMAKHRGQVNAVMIGVGAAFDYHAGTIKRAPLWMQHSGLEWMHRLASEPKRLWKRYLLTNSLFVYLVTRQVVFKRSSPSRVVMHITRHFKP